MFEIRLSSHRRIGLIALVVTGAACGPRPETVHAPLLVGGEHGGSTTQVPACDDGPSRGHLSARVVCKDDALEGSTWFDSETFGTGADAHRLCDTTLLKLTGDGACRGVRACMDQPLGPAPEVHRSTAILR